MTLRGLLGGALAGIAIVAWLPATGVAAGDGAKSARPPKFDRLKHIVVMMQENRSYDEYFGRLHAQGQPKSSKVPKTGNPDPTNPTAPPILPFHQAAYCEVDDVDHSWN